MPCILWPGAVFKFDAYFSDILGILRKKTKGGGLTPKEKIKKPAHFVF